MPTNAKEQAVHRVLLILMVWIVSPALHASPERWHFVTEDFPPFTYPAAATSDTPPSAGVDAGGPLVEIVEAVCARLQKECAITLYPWRRAMQMAEQGQAEGIFSLLRSPRREEIFHISRMLVTTRYSVFARTDSSFVFNSPDDLSGRLIGVYGPSGTSFVLSERLESVTDVRVHLTGDNRRLLRMLQSGRFGQEGLAVLNQDVAWHLIDHEGLTGIREAGEMGSMAYGIGLSRQRVSEEDFQAFEQALDQAIADGTVPTILRRYQLDAAY